MARYVSGLILAAIVMLIIAYAPPFACQIVVLAVALVSAWEYFSLIGAQPLVKLGGVILSVAGVAKFAFHLESEAVLGFFYAVLAFSFAAALLSSRGDARERAFQVAFSCLGVTYVSVGIGFLARLFWLDGYRFWVFLTLVATFIGDTGAYFAGRAFGKTKLAPEISPGKTVAGLYGACAAGAFGAFVVWEIFKPAIPWWKLPLVGIGVALVGALGDLCESLLKRSFDVKDSGTLIPGHGGMLDRIDGLLFAAPFVYLLRVWL
jgi:phosphatidate cytidylyltransferase